MVSKIVRGKMIDDSITISSKEATIQAVGVYGTLREGKHNHALMQGLQQVLTCTLSKYCMFTMQKQSSDGFNHVPYIVYTGKAKDKVVIEVYNTTTATSVAWTETLKRLDALECHPVWYTRRLAYADQDIHKEYPFWVYVFEAAMAREYKEAGLNKHVPSGDYVEPTRDLTGRTFHYPRHVYAALASSNSNIYHNLSKEAAEHTRRLAEPAPIDKNRGGAK